MGNIATFSGIVATHRVYHKGGGEFVTFATLGTAWGEYVEVIFPSIAGLKHAAFVEGIGTVEVKDNNSVVTVNRWETFTVSEHRRKHDS